MDTVDIIVNEYIDAKHLKFLKAIRRETKLNLRMAKQAVAQHPPFTLLIGIEQEKATALINEFEQYGVMCQSVDSRMPSHKRSVVLPLEIFSFRWK